MADPTLTAISPLAPKRFAKMGPIEGVRLSVAEAGIKFRGRPDVMVMVFDAPTSVAGVFTQSKCPSAPVEVCRQHLSHGSARILVVNAGNANAFTGLKGRETTAIEVEHASKAIGCAPHEVFLASTGVIGEPLDAMKFSHLLQGMADEAVADGWALAASAIMTTDTYPKMVARKVVIDGVTITINGIAKGAGMIAPDMATMLSYVATDAPIAPALLQAMLSKSVKTTFNAITVDSDTSTSDSLMAFATGKAALAPMTDAKDARAGKFARAFHKVLHELAMQVVSDGEGARKRVEIRVEGAKSAKSARVIAMAIGNSPLVKTAIAGEDANWGRVVMAVGKAGEPADRDQLSIWFGDVEVARNGERSQDYDEAAASAVMKQDHIVITTHVGVGRGKAVVWTCDLTKEYVMINGDYRS